MDHETKPNPLLLPFKAISSSGLILACSGFCCMATGLQFGAFANGLDSIILYTGWMEIFCYNSLLLGLVIGSLSVLGGFFYVGSKPSSLYFTPICAILGYGYAHLSSMVIEDSQIYFTDLQLGTIIPNFWLALVSMIMVLGTLHSAILHHKIDNDLLTDGEMS